jgi:hypothetical protein
MTEAHFGARREPKDEKNLLIRGDSSRREPKNVAMSTPWPRALRRTVETVPTCDREAERPNVKVSSWLCKGLA